MVPFDSDIDRGFVEASVASAEKSDFDIDVKTEEALAKLGCGRIESCGTRNNGMVLGMAYVPFQEFDDLYDEELALRKGTLFAPLDLPFLGRRIMCDE